MAVCWLVCLLLSSQKRTKKTNKQTIGGQKDNVDDHNKSEMITKQKKEKKNGKGNNNDNNKNEKKNERKERINQLHISSVDLSVDQQI